MSQARPPYLGAAYYPEDWPAEQVDEDIRLMKEARINVARVGEFAWSCMEPQEGVYDFDWLHRVVDKLGAAGIATIMCTPTATPPAWLTERYPSVLAVGSDGVRAQHGARRHVCPNSWDYGEQCTRIVERMAQEFGHDENVIGWQIDNEVYLWQGWGCYCEECVRRFRLELQDRFETIDALNAAWGMNLWSHTYQSFGQIPAPRRDTRHHPSLVADWWRFHSDSLVEYVTRQACLLRMEVDRSQLIGTDMMPVLGVNYRDMHEHLDLVQYNHYDQMENLWRQVFWMDYVRPIKDRPFWNTETATCWNGGTTANGYKEPGFCRANSWLPIALGGEANLYWLWRSHWSGQELMHGSVVSSCGRPLHMFDEVQELGDGFAACSDFLTRTKPTPAKLAVHCSGHAFNTFRAQAMVNKFEYPDALINRVYRPIMDAHLRADVIDPVASLDGYKVVFSPFLPWLDEEGLRERLYEWIKAGGIWVVGPLSDNRTVDGTKFTDTPFGCLEEWAGVYCTCQIPGDPRDFGVRWADGACGVGEHESHGSVWYDAFDAGDADVLATYTEGPFAGQAAVTRTRVGEGSIVLLGTMPVADDLRALLLGLAGEAKVRPAADASPNVLVVPRKGRGGSGCVIVELGNQSGRVKLPRKGNDLLSGKDVQGEIEIAPYEVLVVKY